MNTGTVAGLKTFVGTVRIHNRSRDTSLVCGSTSQLAYRPRLRNSGRETERADSPLTGAEYRGDRCAVSEQGMVLDTPALVAVVGNTPFR